MSIRIFELCSEMKCRNKQTRKKVDILRLFLSLQENEETAEAVRALPFLYDKSKKEYEGKNVAMDVWKEVAD